MTFLYWHITDEAIKQLELPSCKRFLGNQEIDSIIYGNRPLEPPDRFIAKQVKKQAKEMLLNSLLMDTIKRKS